MASITAAVGGGNWTTGATWVGAVAPTASDDAIFTITSGNVTVDAGAVCRSLQIDDTYVGTLTHTAGVTLTIGDGTAGTGNVALRLGTMMTYTKGSTTTSAISFISTSATVQSITFSTKTHANLTFAGVAGSWSFADNATGASTTLTVVTLTDGTLNTNGKACAWGSLVATGTTARSLTLGASAITIAGTGAAWSCATTTLLTLSAASATVTLSGAGVTFNHGGTVSSGGAFGTLVLPGSGSATISVGSSAISFVAITRTGTAVKGDSFSISTVAAGASTVTIGVLTVNGNATTNRLLVFSSTFGVARTLAVTTLNTQYTDWRDIDAAGGADWNLAAITGLSGDAGGNTGITFTGAATQTSTGTVSFTWSTHGWTSRVPLPQDNVIIGNAFSASQTVTADMPRLGKDITWTASGSPIWALSISAAMHGSLVLVAGMTTSGTTTLVLAGRGAHTVTSVAVVFTFNISSSAGLGGSYTLLDAFSSSRSAASAFSLSGLGTFDAGGFSVTLSGAAATVVLNTGTLNMGTGTWAMATTAAGTFWNVAATAVVVNHQNSTVALTAASANSRTFAGLGKAFGTLTYTVAGSTGSLVVSGTGTSIGTINFSDASNARTLQLGGPGQEFRDTVNIFGTAGKLMTVNSSAGQRVLRGPVGIVSLAYVALQDIDFQPNTLWFAGHESTDSGNVFGMRFTDPTLNRNRLLTRR